MPNPAWKPSAGKGTSSTCSLILHPDNLCRFKKVFIFPRRRLTSFRVRNIMKVVKKNLKRVMILNTNKVKNVCLQSIFPLKNYMFQFFIKICSQSNKVCVSSVCSKTKKFRGFYALKVYNVSILSKFMNLCIKNA